MFKISTKLRKGCKFLKVWHKQLFGSQRNTGVGCWYSTALRKLEFETDRYNGVMVNLQQLNLQTVQNEDFNNLLIDSLKSWRDEKRTVAWLHIPITHSRFISLAGNHGFEYHHAEGSMAMMKLWLKTTREDPTPIFGTHQVGVSGVVINEKTEEILVVQDKNRPYTLWKFPGGLSDLGEDIGKTAEREIFEETGIKSEFKSVLSMRQQHNLPGAFGRSDFYIICRMKPLTFEISACVEEIRECKWMHIEDLKREIEVSSLTMRLTDMVEYGLREGWDVVDIGCEEMESIYKGFKFKLYHRPFHKQSGSS